MQNSTSGTFSGSVLAYVLQRHRNSKTHTCTHPWAFFVIDSYEYSLLGPTISIYTAESQRTRVSSLLRKREEGEWGRGRRKEGR